jgi:hypothetical protein
MIYGKDGNQTKRTDGNKNMRKIPLIIESRVQMA